jgi:hypothetical protein
MRSGSMVFPGPSFYGLSILRVSVATSCAFEEGATSEAGCRVSAWLEVRNRSCGNRSLVDVP